MTIEKFFPQSPDPNLNVGPDMTLARFGHLNKLVDDINAGCGGGGGGGGIIDNSEGLLTAARIGVDNIAYGDYGSALTGCRNITCNEYTASTWGRQSCAIGCYSSVNGTSNVVVARNSHILSGTNNTIACDATQGAWNTQSSYSGNYFGFTVPPSAQLTYGCIYVPGCDLTSQWPVGSTFSMNYSYTCGDSLLGCPTQIQAVDVEVVCSVYNGSGYTCLYFCYDPDSPSFQGSVPDGTYSYGYLQKTGTFSSYSTYGATYHPNTIAGGAFNTINGYTSAATISGGYQNTISGGYGTISGGYYNYNVGGGFIAGGSSNHMINSVGFAGGNRNCICTSYSSVALGYGHCIMSSQYASALGGTTNTICLSSYGSITGGRLNRIDTSSNYASIVGSGNSCVIGGSTYSGIIGGNFNTINALPYTYIIGNNICANRAGAVHVNNLSIRNIPTASAGLPSGSVWSNAGVLTIVP